jgi:hypothetical protein
MKRFDELSEPEVLALAISDEEEDSRVYADFARLLTPLARAGPRPTSTINISKRGA